MTAPVSSQPALNPMAGASGPSAQSRWARTGEPGSAFSGLTRGGRGRGNSRGRGGGGGGRGGRGGATTRETKIGDTSDKIDVTTRPALSTNTAPKLEQVTQPSGHEKISVVPNSRPKGPSRRTSRTIPAGSVAQSSPSAPPSPAATHPNNRRRRSQSGKPNVLPNIHVPSSDDNFLRPPRNRFASAPHSAPAKDTPPHLAKSFDMRNNIDALVERVRAVAMADNRPSTPGSHIDWAGDDDDSLPDLDDWGVTPGISVEDKEEISPIIVDGLKSLPELVMKPDILSSEEGEQPANDDYSSTRAVLSEKEGRILSVVSQDAQLHHEEKNKSPKTTSINSLSNTTIRKGPGSVASSTRPPLHPSLPPKPVVSPEVSVVLPKSRHGPTTTPIRNSSPQKSLNIPADKPDSKPVPTIAVQSDQRETSPEEQATAPPIHSLPRAPGTLMRDISSVSAPAAQSESLNKDGLLASIHAPTSLLESASAPAGLGSYPSTGTPAANRTHTRAHTVGKLSVPGADLVRHSRSGYSTPQGGSEGYHARTHSSPPAGVMLKNHRSPNDQRPVLTGDALSRLARTIGSTALSPPRAAAVIN